MKADAHLVVLRSALDAEELAELRLFDGADLDTVSEILRDCSLHVLRKDELLLAPGATNDHLYLLLRGRLRVHLDTIDSAPVRVIESGEAIGETSLIDEKPMAAYVVADAGSTVLAIDRTRFWMLINASHAVARNMLLTVLERMRANNTAVTAGMRPRDGFQYHVTVDDLTGLARFQSGAIAR